MDTNTQNSNDLELNSVRLTRGINIPDLVNGKGVEFEVDVNDLEEDSTGFNIFGNDNIDELLQNCTINGLGLIEDDGYDEASPFESFAAKMSDVFTHDGKLKKRIVREGCGEIVLSHSKVSIHYNGYLEYHDEPFDSTYMRKRPYTFELGTGETIPGLEFAISTMKLNEKSQFLIHPDFAYGKHGCMDRIPENATLLFEIELLKIILPGGFMKEEIEAENDKVRFDIIFKKCVALQLSGKDQFAKSCYKQAVTEYNKALTMLENAFLDDMEDQNKQEDLRIKLNTNLAICYNKLNLPRKACAACNRVTNILRGNPTRVPAKIWFSKGKALMALLELNEAQTCLKKAQRLAPMNKEISQQLLLLQELVKKQQQNDAAMAQKMFSGNKPDVKKEHNFNISEQFEQSIKQACIELKGDKDRVHYNMPGQLTNDEQDFIKQECVKYDLEFHVYSRSGIEKFYISKRKEDK